METSNCSDEFMQALGRDTIPSNEVRRPNSMKAHVSIVLAVMPVLIASASSIAAQTDRDLHRRAAIDYYVGVLVQYRELVGENEHTVESLKQAAANYFVQAHHNTDDVISAQDAVDAARVTVAAYDVKQTANLFRYDLDRDSIVTQDELEVSFVRQAWLETSGWKPSEEDYSNARARFELRLDELTSNIRARADAEAEGDIALSGAIERTYTYQDELGDPNLIGPPYFAIFDLDGDLGVGVNEFFDPIIQAIKAVDTDGDGDLSEVELAEVSRRYEESQEVLRPFREEYALKLE